MKTHLLENNFLKLNVAELGAEMRSLQTKSNQRDYLWQANADYWARTAPVLFPIVGKVKDNVYQSEEKTYTISQHGFARDRVFGLIDKTASTIVFQLESDDESLKYYPYKFVLTISYTLKERSVWVHYKVHNSDQKNIWFSIGAHPGFAILVNEDEVLDDYFLEFSGDESLSQLHLEKGLIVEKEKSTFSLNNKRLGLNAHIFDQDALIFETVQSEKVFIVNKRGDYKLSVSVQPFPYLGIWAKPGAPFVCIEPWFGLADPVSGSAALQTKPAILSLQPGQDFACGFEIQIHA